MIIFDQVTKTFPNGDTVIGQADFHIKPGEFAVFTGPSGAGKTTIGRLIIKDLRPSKGKIIINGKDIIKIKSRHIPSFRRQIGTVFQDYKIIPDKTVFENIALNLEIANFAPSQIASKIDHLLKLTGIPDKADLFPSQLSGGELQRASLARAIATEPHILFADEPTGNLDEKTSKEIYDLLKKINETGTTVIIASHDKGLFTQNSPHHIHLEKGKITFDSIPVKKTKPSPKSKIKTKTEKTDQDQKEDDPKKVKLSKKDKNKK